MNYKLSNEKSNEEKKARTLNEGKAARPCDKDKCLTYDANLEIQCSHHFILAVPNRSHTKMILHK